MNNEKMKDCKNMLLFVKLVKLRLKAAHISRCIYGIQLTLLKLSGIPSFYYNQAVLLEGEGQSLIYQPINTQQWLTLRLDFPFWYNNI